MRIAVITVAFPPLCSSGAVQMRDLAQEMLRQGHLPTVIIPTADIQQAWLLETVNGVQVLRVKAGRNRDISYIRRTVNEFLMPFVMRYHMRNSPLANLHWDGVVWYSPSIFFGPLVKALKQASHCRSYLIVRDIFPEWAVDMGLMSRGLPYRFFKLIENFQYAVADVIGMQAPGNHSYFTQWQHRANLKVEVLHNWLADAPNTGCSISVQDTLLAGRKILVYAGNMGVAQGMGIILDLAERLKHRTDIGFLFVGRGSESQQMQKDALNRALDNVMFFDEINPEEIPGLYAQCHVGLVALDPRHKTHNIPGKFLSYMFSGLPVLASINAGNDLVDIIKQERVGRVCTNASVALLSTHAIELIQDISADNAFKQRCKQLAARLFSPEVAVKQIITALQA